MPIFNSHKWAVDQFVHAILVDIRRTQRLTQIAQQLAYFSGGSVARACDGVDAKIEGTYRLLRNEHVIPNDIRRAGFQCTAKKARDFDEILAIEDTTSLSYKHSVASDLGKLGQSTDIARGWNVLSLILLDASTTQTIGLIFQDGWLRPNVADKSEENESGKWPDIKAYMEDKMHHGERFVVRAKHNRKLNKSDGKLFDYMNKKERIGGYTIDIPQKE